MPGTLMNAPLPTPAEPTPPLATSVPVVPATQERIRRQVYARLTKIVGILILGFPTWLPSLKQLLPAVPDKTWQALGGLVILIGEIWNTAQTANSAGKTQTVNYSEPASGGLER